MTKTGMLIELDLLFAEPLNAANEGHAVLALPAMPEETVAQLLRLDKAGVGLVILSQYPFENAQEQLAEMATSCGIGQLPYLGLTADSPASWQWPKPAQILRACTEHGLDIFNSWVIGQNHNLFKAASQAGLVGAVYIGDAMPADNCGLQVLNQARSLADAPRVMIPPKGGCWHEHQ